MYSEIQRERADIEGLMARPEYREWNSELIKPKKLLNPVKASRSHQELHRELLMNHKRGLGMDRKPELQRVLEHRRRNQLIKKKEEELEAKRMQCPFEQELLRRQQRLNQPRANEPLDQLWMSPENGSTMGLKDSHSTVTQHGCSVSL
uniref:Actin-associated protein FAM107A n=1 Tax=Rattus norvegicus TaxID=10116 RepID=A0ABK0LRC8_RAT